MQLVFVHSRLQLFRPSGFNQSQYRSVFHNCKATHLCSTVMLTVTYHFSYELKKKMNTDLLTCQTDRVTTDPMLHNTPRSPY